MQIQDNLSRVLWGFPIPAAVVSYSVQSYGIWKCEEKPDEPCVKNVTEICGDKYGPFIDCNCTAGYNCTQQVSPPLLNNIRSYQCI